MQIDSLRNVNEILQRFIFGYVVDQKSWRFSRIETLRIPDSVGNFAAAIELHLREPLSPSKFKINLATGTQMTVQRTRFVSSSVRFLDRVQL